MICWKVVEPRSWNFGCAALGASLMKLVSELSVKLKMNLKNNIQASVHRDWLLCTCLTVA